MTDSKLNVFPKRCCFISKKIVATSNSDLQPPPVVIPAAIPDNIVHLLSPKTAEVVDILESFVDSSTAKTNGDRKRKPEGNEMGHPRLKKTKYA